MELKLNYQHNDPRIKQMLNWLEANVEPNGLSDMRPYNFSTVGMFKEWRSVNRAWEFCIRGMSPSITVIIKDEKLATLFALTWSN